ncbi:MAG: hypothetical protein E7473_12335, partial [Ruminococcaceae bacterium]|nr:hypothetical protein [Oscillospiraceae bacterium]
MKIIHVYNEKCFKGWEKNGMINRDTGFKIQNVFSVPEEFKFNEIAKIGGKLHSLIKENKFPLYIDRVAGGITYQRYDFDKNLLREYINILGDWFLGIQLHESGSNRREADWPRLIRAMGSKGPYDVKKMDELMKSKTAITPKGEILHTLSQGTIEEYSKLTFAETYDEYYEEMRNLFKRNMNDIDGLILPCDSYYLMTRLQDELGMRTFMPEVGWQIPLMRLEVALARGVSRASNKTWGTYYECWKTHIDENGKEKCTMPCFNHTHVNEWYLSQKQHGDDFTTFGANGGSSRLLQNRIYYYALMSGAHYFSEEWGLNCSFYDMESFELSPYGKTKKDFIGVAEKLRGIHVKVPFAIVLPQKYSAVQIRLNFPWMDKNAPYEYMRASVSKEDETYFKQVEGVLNYIFQNDGKGYGNENHTITNSRFGDVFDVVYEDTSPVALSKYEYLIDATPDGAFSKANTQYKIIGSADLDKLREKLEEAIKEVMPIWADDLCWLVS